MRGNIGKKFRLGGILAVVLCCCALTAFAANSLGKPAAEGDVPGNWTADHGSDRYLWFSVRDSNNQRVEKALQWYSPEVRKHFADPPLSEFGDHPDFTNGMNDNYDNPTGIVKILTNAQMNNYLESLPKGNMTIRYMGDYPKGLRMPVLIFSEPRLSDPSGENLRALGKPIYYLRAQVHGNEIAAAGGALLLAQRLAQKHPDMDGVLDKISIVILPRFNADGSKLHQRGTSLVSGDSWGSGAPDYLVSLGEGGGVSEYGGGIMAGLDQNRDNLWLGAPASRANARILSEYKPEICLDAHEYGSSSYFGVPLKQEQGDGFVYVTDPVSGRIVLQDAYPGTLVYYREQMTTQWGNHLMIPEALRNKNEEVQQKIVAGLERADNPSGSFYWAPYVEGSYGLQTSAANGNLANAGLISLDQLPTAAEREKMRKWADAEGRVPHYDSYNVSTEGGFDPGTARNTMGLTPALSFLTESRSAGGRWEYPRRVMGQYLTSVYLIRAVIDDLDGIKSEVARARAAVIADVGDPSKKIAIRQDYATMNYANVESYSVYFQDGSSADVPGVRRNSRFGTAPTFEVTRPYAYVMDGSYGMADTIAFRMSHLDVKFERLTEATELDVVAYTVTNVRAAAPSFGSSCRIDGVSSASVKKTFPAGSYVFYMDQQMANFAAALFEPVSMRSWAGKDLADMGVVLGKVMPFYRYEKSERIATAEAIEMPILDFTDFFLFNARAADAAKLREAREATGTAGFAQTMILYGNALTDSSFRAYLPSDGARRTWYIYDPEAEAYVAKEVAFDSGMNRRYIVIDKSSLVPGGDGYYSFDMLATPAGSGTSGSSSGGGSGGCDAGFAPLALLALIPAIAGSRRAMK